MLENFVKPKYTKITELPTRQTKRFEMVLFLKLNYEYDEPKKLTEKIYAIYF